MFRQEQDPTSFQMPDPDSIRPKHTDPVEIRVRNPGFPTGSATRMWTTHVKGVNRLLAELSEAYSGGGGVGMGTLFSPPSPQRI